MACGTCASTHNRVTTCVKCCAAAPQRKRSSLRLSRCGRGAATAERKTAKPWAHAALWYPSSNCARIPTWRCTPAEDDAGIPSVRSLRERSGETLRPPIRRTARQSASVRGTVATAALARLLRGRRFLRVACRRSLLEQTVDQVAEVNLILQVCIALPKTLGANHAGAVDHHHLGNPETFHRRATQVAVHLLRRGVADRIADSELPRKARHFRPADTVVEGYANGLQTARAQLLVELGNRLCHAQAARTIGEQELDHYHFALETREQYLLARRLDDGEFGRFAGHRPCSDQRRNTKRQENG